MNNIFDNKKVLNVPNLRFPEFTDEWVESRLGEIAILTKGQGLSKEQLSATGQPCILYGELYTTYKNEIIGNIYSKTEVSDIGLIKSRLNDVIIPSSGESAIDISTARCVNLDNIILGGDLNIIRLNTDSGAFLSYQLNGQKKLEIAKIAQGASVVHLYNQYLKKLKVNIPNKLEQTKIAKLLSIIDQRIETQNKIIKDLKSFKKGVASIIYRKIESACCKKNCINDIITYEQPTKYLVNSENYVSFAKEETPVLTANKSFLLGYTNENTGIYSKGDCIIFDDFTMDFKYVAFPFKIKSSAIKILTAPTSITLKFIYEYFNYLELQATDHKRHYISEVSRIKIVLPNYAVQKRTVAILTAIELKMENEINILQKYKTKKAFLLNNMFI